MKRALTLLAAILVLASAFASGAIAQNPGKKSAVERHVVGKKRLAKGRHGAKQDSVTRKRLAGKRRGAADRRGAAKQKIARSQGGHRKLLAKRGTGKLHSMAKELGLTDEQKSRFQALARERKAKVRAIRSDARLTPEQKREKLTELKRTSVADIRGVLTPDQMAKVKDRVMRRNDIHRKKKRAKPDRD